MIQPKITYLFSIIIAWPPQLKLHPGAIHSIPVSFPGSITLQRPKYNGPIDAPIFQQYYITNQLQYIIECIKVSRKNDIWLDTEQALCKESSILDLSFIATAIKCHSCLKNTMITATLTTQWKFYKTINSPAEHPPTWHSHVSNISVSNREAWKRKKKLLSTTQIHYIV